MIETVVRAVDPSCQVVDVAALVERVFRQRPQRRALARLLTEDSGVLTVGLVLGPRSVERLIRALVEAGATGVVVPRCADCARQKPLTAPGPEGRICTVCDNRRRLARLACAVCGRRDVATRDREGRPRCQIHPPDPGVDPTAELARLLAPLTALPENVIAQAVTEAEPRRPGQLRLWWALSERPDLLSGAGAAGPKAISTLAAALLTRGASGVVLPLCPFCQATGNLRSQRDGQRCCAACWSAARPRRCTRCRRERPVAGYTADGEPLCGPCLQTEPFNFRPCDNCGELRLRAVRTTSGGLCRECTETPHAVCATCGAWRRCWFAATTAPRCQPCTAKARPQAVCVRCGQHRRINNRTATGEPVCATCGVPPRACAECGKTHRPAGRTDRGRPLCQTCWIKHPRARKPCARCGTLERLYHQNRCASCARDRSLREILTGPDGRPRPEHTPVLEALRKPDPRAVLRWIHKTPARQSALRALAQTPGPVTHELLDRITSERVASHLRALLVAGGALPERDEHLARLERWLPRNLARITDARERRIVDHYIRWQPIRRLRRQPHGRQVTHGQADALRHEVRTLVRLLEWLHSTDSSLARCTQDEIDVYLSDGPGNRTVIRGFLTWTSRHRHTAPLTSPVYTSTFAADILAADHRWALVRRLLHDPGITDSDRAAGLLLLLFAQPPARICRLTVDDIVHTHDGRLQLHLGHVPVDLPPPLDTLCLHLAEHPRGRGPILSGQPPRWLFPGAYAGRPMEPSSLAFRLKSLGIRVRPARHASLMELARELPAYVFSRLLGFAQATADNWTAETGIASSYAADLSRRPLAAGRPSGTNRS
ncbi:hypothetical protein OH787_06360 [Streptomyces sp. NBC_01547]|uniref:hypothetical protein n=1 Tax=Streptomyces sp. NBC_01547 TaxID=2975873 RepID=UPI00386AE931